MHCSQIQLSTVGQTLHWSLYKFDADTNVQSKTFAVTVTNSMIYVQIRQGWAGMLLCKDIVPNLADLCLYIIKLQVNYWP